MRIRVTRIDDRPTYLPLPSSGELEFHGELKPEYLFQDGRVYLTVESGEFSAIIDGSITEFVTALDRATITDAYKAFHQNKPCWLPEAVWMILGGWQCLNH